LFRGRRNHRTRRPVSEDTCGVEAVVRHPTDRHHRLETIPPMHVSVRGEYALHAIFGLASPPETSRSGSPTSRGLKAATFWQSAPTRTPGPRRRRRQRRNRVTIRPCPCSRKIERMVSDRVQSGEYSSTTELVNTAVKNLLEEEHVEEEHASAPGSGRPGLRSLELARDAPANLEWLLPTLKAAPDSAEHTEQGT